MNLRMDRTMFHFIFTMWFMGVSVTKGLRRDANQSVQCPSERLQENILKRVLEADMPDSLKSYVAATSPPADKSKERILVAPGVHVFVGHGYANCVVLEAPRGLIVIDTLIDANLANPVISQIREEIGTYPFKALIYTNMGPDHVGGAKAFIDSQPGQHIDVWSYRRITRDYWHQWTYVKPATTLRKYREEARDFPSMTTYSENSPEMNDVTEGVLEVPPNRFVRSRRLRAEIAGLLVELCHLPGASDHEIGIYIRKHKVLVIGDNFQNYFPTIYSMTGALPAPNILNWIDSLNDMLDMDVEILAAANTRPIIGKDAIHAKLKQYIDVMKFLHDQTMRWINRGFHAEEIVQELKVPPSMSTNPDLAEFQGTSEWAIQGIYQSTMGWFNGFPEAMFPLTPRSQVKRWTEIVTRNRILMSARKAIKKGTPEDLRWALHTTSLLWYMKEDLSDSLLDSLFKIRRDALVKLAESQTSLKARNYLLRWLLEDSCLVNNSSPAFSDTDAILHLPIDHLVNKLCVMLKAEEVEGVNRSVLLRFTDIKKTFNLRLQNSVLDINQGKLEDFDFQMEINSTNFRQVLLGKLHLRDAGATVQPNITLAYEFLGYFDDAGVSYFH